MRESTPTYNTKQNSSPQSDGDTAIQQTKPTVVALLTNQDSMLALVVVTRAHEDLHD
jgi:hypothetical protein